MEHFEKQISTTPLYSGRVVQLRLDEVELENGNTSTREVIHHSGGVAVLALDDDGCILFVRQFRYPYSQVLLEIPAGKLNEGEDPYSCGLRELEEETGYTAETYEFLAQAYPTPGYTDEILHLYTAKNLKKTAQNLDEDEFLTVEKIPYKQALQMCLDGGIKDAKTLIALMMYEIKTRG